MLYVLIAGLRRVSRDRILQYNGAFLSLLSLDRFPYASTLRRFLPAHRTASGPPTCTAHDDCASGCSVCPEDLLGVDLRFGRVGAYRLREQQGARLGYNPKKRGRRSYIIPLLCFESPGRSLARLLPTRKCRWPILEP